MKLSNHELTSAVRQITEAAEYDHEETDYIDLSERGELCGYLETIEYYRFNTMVTLRGADISASGLLKSYDGGKTFDIDNVEMTVVNGDETLLDDYDYDELNAALYSACSKFYRNKQHEYVL